jgi:hypothetical protein
MARPLAGLRSPVLLAASDLVAIVVFVTIGLISHHRGLSATGYARDTLPLAGGWFGAAALFRPYGDPPRRRALLATWACGIPAGVLARALVLGRSLNGGEAAFLGVSMVTIGLFVLAVRSALLLGEGARVGT